MECDSCRSDTFTFLFHHHHQWKVQQCTSCGLVQVIPRPHISEIRKLYENDVSHFTPYLEQAEVHKKYFTNKLQELKNKLKTQNSKLPSPITILDVGCLTGVLLTVANEMGMKTQGVDISQDAVNYCVSQGLAVSQGTIGNFWKKHKKKKYSIITAFEIIEHEYSPKEMLSSIWKLLDKNGVVAISTPNYGSWWRKIMGKYWPGYQHREHLFFYDPESLQFLFRSVGFREISIVTGDSRPFPLSFLFTRAGDYFPFFVPFFNLFARIVKPFGLKNPINPWDDILVIAQK